MTEKTIYKMNKLHYNSFPRSFSYCINPEHHTFMDHKFKQPETDWLPTFAKKELNEHNKKLPKKLKVRKLCLYAIATFQ